MLKCEYYFEDSDMIHSKLETRNFFSKHFDSYGDSYEEEITETELKEIFNTMTDNSMNEGEFIKNRIREQIAEIEIEHFNDESYNMGIFRLNTFYVDKYDNSKLNLVELKLKWHGGVVKSEIDDTITHCVLHKGNLNHLEEIKKLNRTRTRKMHILSSEWVEASIKAGQTVQELPYHL